MKQVKVFKGTLCSLYTNAVHAAFMQRIYDELHSLLDREEKLHISDALMEEFNAFIGMETELNKEAKRLLNTSTRGTTDQERDDVVVYMLQEMKNAARSPIAAKKKAGEALGPVVDAYVGIQNDAQDAETLSIRGLILDLKKMENAPHVTTLGLDEVVAKLEELNNQYDRERKELSSKTLADKKENSVAIRPKTDAVLNRILDLIYASEVLAVEEETGDQAYIETEIDAINVIIDEYRTRYNMSQAQKKANKKPGEQPSDENKGDGNLEFVPVEK